MFKRRAITLFVVTLVACFASASSVSIVSAAEPSNEDAAVLKRRKLMFLQCRACHELAAGQPNKVGPNLHGMMKRPAAAVEGFVYTDVLRGAGLQWDKATLDRWIERPSALVPGTTMAFAGIANEADRRALITYLELATR